MTETASEPPTISARLDRLPILAAHRFAVFVIGLGLFFDAYDNFLASTISAVLRQEMSLDRNELNLLLGSAFIGQFLGAIVMGRFADRVGRRPAFMINLAIYSFASLAGAFAPNAMFLVITRFIAGIGIGAEYALADSYLSDLLPKNARGRLISWAYTVSFFAVPLVGLLGRWLTPHELDLGAIHGFEGWRILFLIGALGSLPVWFVRRGLPESPRWLESRGRYAEADAITSRFEQQARDAGHILDEPDTTLRLAPPAPKQTVRQLLGQLFRPPLRRRTTMLWLLSTLEVFGYYGFGAIAPLVLAAKGFDVVTSLGYVALIYLGYPVGAALAIPIVERIERKFLVIGGAAAMAGFGLWFGFADSTEAIVISGFMYSVASNLFSNAYHVYLADSYPTRIRATASGAAYSLSKLTTGALPFILLPVLDGHGSGAVFAVVAVAMGLLMLTVALLGHRSTGRSADELDLAAAGPTRGNRN